jgi:hypothetical protein
MRKADMSEDPGNPASPAQYVEIDVDRAVWDRGYRDALRRVLAVEAELKAGRRPQSMLEPPAEYCERDDD